VRPWFFAVLLGCAGGEDSDLTLCEDAPVVTWDNFGAGFILENCQPCHASTAAYRHGAPEETTFDSEAEVAVWTNEILERATGQSPTMPPQGGVDEDERTQLAIWLTCYPPDDQ